MNVHHNHRIWKQTVVEPVCKAGQWPPKGNPQVLIGPPWQYAVILESLKILVGADCYEEVGNCLG